MKRFKNILSVLTFLVILTSIKSVFSQSVGIGSTSFTPDPSSMLEVQATGKGILIPRMTWANKPVAPISGLLIYSTDGDGINGKGYYYWEGSWIKVGSGLNWSLTGNTGTAVATNFLGTTDYVGLVFKTNGLERMRLQNDGQLTIGSTTAGGKLDVHQSSSNDVARFTTYGNSNDIRLRRTSGTQGTPTITSTAGTIIGRFTAEGYDGSDYTNVASISMEIDSAATGPTNMPGRIVFSTYKAATPTLPGAFAERMRIGNNGNVGIGTNPVSKARLYVRSSGSIAGTGYGSNSCNAVYGAGGGAAWAFGVTGYTGVNAALSGGVHGANSNGAWAALGYYDNSSVSYAGYFNGKVWANDQIVSTLASGTSPFNVTSTTINTNLNADMVDGYHAFVTPISTQNINYTLTTNDYTVIFNGSGLTATLPAVGSCTGRIFNVVNHGPGALTITSFQNLSDSPITSLASGISIIIQSNGTNWYQIR
jgi:hypothetical protein